MLFRERKCISQSWDSTGCKWIHVLDTGGRLDPFQVAVGHLSLTVIVTKSSYDFKNGG